MYVLGRQVDRFAKCTFWVDRSTGLLNILFWSTGRQVCYMSMFLLFYSRSTGLLSVNVLARQVLICICISQVDRFQIVIIPFRVFDRISRVFRPIHTGDFLLQFDRCDLLF